MGVALYKGGVFAGVYIFEPTANDGTENWTVPTSLTDGTDYTIRITDKVDGTFNAVSEAFSILGAAAPGIE